MFTALHSRPIVCNMCSGKKVNEPIKRSFEIDIDVGNDFYYMINYEHPKVDLYLIALFWSCSAGLGKVCHLTYQMFGFPFAIGIKYSFFI